MAREAATIAGGRDSDDDVDAANPFLGADAGGDADPDDLANPFLEDGADATEDKATV